LELLNNIHNKVLFGNWNGGKVEESWMLQFSKKFTYERLWKKGLDHDESFGFPV
jgi:hypothetical protein